MGKPKRNLLATAQETLTPPSTLKNGQIIAKVIKGEGKNLWSVQMPGREGPLLVEMPARFRSTIWLKRGGFVVIDTTVFEERENKLQGQIVNVVRDEKQWRKQTYWYALRIGHEIRCSSQRRPTEFDKRSTYPEESEDEESAVAKMPPAEESD
ncbi:MAG: hypothetical protein Q9163_001933 [Psora crenata]